MSGQCSHAIPSAKGVDICPFFFFFFWSTKTCVNLDLHIKRFIHALTSHQKVKTGLYSRSCIVREGFYLCSFWTRLIRKHQKDKPLKINQYVLRFFFIFYFIIIYQFTHCRLHILVQFSEKRDRPLHLFNVFTKIHNSTMSIGSSNIWLWPYSCMTMTL